MNYEDGIKLLPYLEKLKHKKLLVSNDWTITNVALLPINKNTVAAYAVVLNWASHGNWIVNEINHQFVYEWATVYSKGDGTHSNDELTFYVMIKKYNSFFNEEYKTDTLVNLINSGEIKKEDIQDFVLQVL